MAKDGFTANLKRDIKPINFTIKVTASKISETGTFSKLEVTEVTSNAKLGGLKVSAPFQGGGAMYLKVDTLDGITVAEAKPEAAPVEKRKLF